LRDLWIKERIRLADKTLASIIEERKTMKKWIKHHLLGFIGASVVLLFILVGVYAPFLASSKPIAVSFDGTVYFPLFRYLFFSGFYTKPLDIFFNLLMFTLPFFLLFWRRPRIFASLLLFQGVAFWWLVFYGISDPASEPESASERQEAIQAHLQGRGPNITWQDELGWMNGYGRLNVVLRYYLGMKHDEALMRYAGGIEVPSVWEMEQKRNREKGEDLAINQKTAELALLNQRKEWIQEQIPKIDWIVMPLIRPFHWEEDAGGSQALNQKLPWSELTRINRKDLVSALIFGVRISLVVGLLAVGLALLIGIPIGALSGYYGGRFDIVVSRLLEIWESMPIFFMLLLVIAMMQSKSIFVVISVIGLFGWTGFSRYIRGEVFKQRHLSYVEACRSIGFGDSYIIFRHILPNAIPPVLTLLPFAIMGAITSEAALSFLGLGEEGSGSWGVLMDEGRSVFPGEVYLLWPPAILLTILLVAIALVGDAVRDTLDPKLRG
jgi:peptide/nickel transport system permease protein